MPRIGGITIRQNRRELFKEPQLDVDEGNRNVTILPEPRQQVVQTEQQFVNKGIPGDKLGEIVDTGNAGVTSIGNLGSDIRFWAGSTFPNRASAPFRVDKDGNLVASSAIINGLTFTSDPDFGDGSDGDVTIAGNTTLTSDMFYDNLIVNNGVTLSPNGYKIFCKTSATINGSIAETGGDGGNGSTGFTEGAAGAAAHGSGSLPASTPGQAGGDGGVGAGGNPADPGVAGDAVTSSVSGTNGSAGGAGGDNGNDTIVGKPGGAGGVATIAKADIRNTANAILFIDSGASPLAQYSGNGGAGSGGGGGYGAFNNGGAGGGSGANGGYILISARTLTLNSGADITADGGDGGDGGNGANDVTNQPGGGGGGAGGGGGVIVLIYVVLTEDGTISVAAGAGGAAGSAFSPGDPGIAGAAGSVGITIKLQKI